MRKKKKQSQLHLAFSLTKTKRRERKQSTLKERWEEVGGDKELKELLIKYGAK